PLFYCGAHYFRLSFVFVFFFQAEDGIRDRNVTGVQTCALPIFFYNTLFDENASCHIALGKAYPTNLEGGSAMSDEKLDQHGVNDSLTHVDFMIGSENLDIDGVKQDGTTEPVFRNGTWALDMTGN